MAGAERSLPRYGDDIDVARVVHVLQRNGPLPVSDLADQPDLADWPAARVEHAIVSAWSSTLIYIDARDRLVAIGTPIGL